MHLPETDITIIDRNSAAPPHVASGVLINGEEVMVEDGSIHLSFGQGEATRVTLTILPRTVTFK